MPASTSVTVAADTLHTVEVVDEKLTARPDEAVALTVNGATPSTFPGKTAKEIVWLPGVTMKPWFTCAAAA
jgi:hypothetical protein